MERKLLYTLFCCLCAAIAAKAQVQLIIDHPISQAGIILPIGLTSNDATWGFNRDTTGPVTAPVACVPGVDSFACAALPPGSLAGKIAIVHRGPDPAFGLGQPCGFGTKALNCQNAGALGVLLIYEPRDGQANDVLPEEISGANPPNTDGELVRIPLVVVSRPTGRRLKPLLCDSGVVTMGGFLGYYDNNLLVSASKGCVSPPAAAIPNYLVRDTGEFVFTPGMEVANVGRRPQSGAVAKATVTRIFNGNSEVIYDHSLVVPDLRGVVTEADTQHVDFPKFDLATIVPGTNRLGIYILNYSVVATSGDQSYTDNEVRYEFQVTENNFSLARLNFNDRDFVTKNFVTPALDGVAPSNRVYRYGVVFRTNQVDAGDSVMARSVRFGVQAGDTVDFTALNLNAELFEWNDADNNGGVADAELSQIANGLLTFDSDTFNRKFFDVPMEDLITGASPVLLAGNKTYLVLMTYRGDDIVSWSYEDAGFSYYRYFREQAPSVISPLYVNQWYAGYVDWPVAALRVDLDIRDNGTVLNMDDLTHPAAVTIAPNPSRDRFRILVADGADGALLTYQVTDLSGRALMNGKIGGKETLVNSEKLPPGLYQVRVSGPKGAAVRKIAIR